MRVGDLLLFNDGSHVLVLRLGQRHGRTLCRVWLAESRKASKDILISKMTMEFNDAQLVARNVQLRSWIMRNQIQTSLDHDSSDI